MSSETNSTEPVKKANGFRKFKRIAVRGGVGVLALGLSYAAGATWGIRWTARELTSRGYLSPEATQKVLDSQESDLRDQEDAAQGFAYGTFAKKVFADNGILYTPHASADEKGLWFDLINKKTGRPIMGTLDGKEVPLAFRLGVTEGSVFDNAKNLGQSSRLRIKVPPFLRSIVVANQVLSKEAEIRDNIDNADEDASPDRGENTQPKGLMPQPGTNDIQ